MHTQKKEIEQKPTEYLHLFLHGHFESIDDLFKAAQQGAQIHRSMIDPAIYADYLPKSLNIDNTWIKSVTTTEKAPALIDKSNATEDLDKLNYFRCYNYVRMLQIQNNGEELKEDGSCTYNRDLAAKSDKKAYVITYLVTADDKKALLKSASKQLAPTPIQTKDATPYDVEVETLRVGEDEEFAMLDFAQILSIPVTSSIKVGKSVHEIKQDEALAKRIPVAYVFNCTTNGFKEKRLNRHIYSPLFNAADKNSISQKDQNNLSELLITVGAYESFDAGEVMRTTNVPLSAFDLKTRSVKALPENLRITSSKKPLKMTESGLLHFVVFQPKETSIVQTLVEARNEVYLLSTYFIKEFTSLPEADPVIFHKYVSYAQSQVEHEPKYAEYKSYVITVTVDSAKRQALLAGVETELDKSEAERSDVVILKNPLEASEILSLYDCEARSLYVNGKRDLFKQPTPVMQTAWRNLQKCLEGLLKYGDYIDSELFLSTSIPVRLMPDIENMADLPSTIDMSVKKESKESGDAKESVSINSEAPALSLTASDVLTESKKTKMPPTLNLKLVSADMDPDTLAGLVGHFDRDVFKLEIKQDNQVVVDITPTVSAHPYDPNKVQIGLHMTIPQVNAWTRNIPPVRSTRKERLVFIIDVDHCGSSTYLEYVKAALKEELTQKNKYCSNVYVTILTNKSGDYTVPAMGKGDKETKEPNCVVIKNEFLGGSTKRLSKITNAINTITVNKNLPSDDKRAFDIALNDEKIMVPGEEAITRICFYTQGKKQTIKVSGNSTTVNGNNFSPDDFNEFGDLVEARIKKLGFNPRPVFFIRTLNDCPDDIFDDFFSRCKSYGMETDMCALSEKQDIEDDIAYHVFRLPQKAEFEIVITDDSNKVLDAQRIDTDYIANEMGVRYCYPVLQPDNGKINLSVREISGKNHTLIVHQQSQLPATSLTVPFKVKDGLTEIEALSVAVYRSDMAGILKKKFFSNPKISELENIKSKQLFNAEKLKKLLEIKRRINSSRRPGVERPLLDAFLKVLDKKLEPFRPGYTNPKPKPSSTSITTTVISTSNNSVTACAQPTIAMPEPDVKKVIKPKYRRRRRGYQVMATAQTTVPVYVVKTKPAAVASAVSAPTGMSAPSAPGLEFEEKNVISNTATPSNVATQLSSVAVAEIKEVSQESGDKITAVKATLFFNSAEQNIATVMPENSSETTSMKAINKNLSSTTEVEESGANLSRERTESLMLAALC